VNAIPLVEQNYPLEWEANGEVEPAVYGIFRVAMALGGILAIYATLVELGWARNLLDLLSSS